MPSERYCLPHTRALTPHLYYWFIFLFGLTTTLLFASYYSPPGGEQTQLVVRPGFATPDNDEEMSLAFRDSFIPPAIPGVDEDLSARRIIGDGDTVVYDSQIAPDKLPQFLWMKLPDYPVKAQENKIGGNVMLKILVDREGEPMRILIASETPQGYGFGPAAVKSAQEALFVPALKNGDRVNCWVSLPVNFALD
ncbi:hypothetical protein TRIP_C60398 [Candidatus Zixiibacteriota bacterium]|nr:hypothetical protein TRIP_C60398 [candidate division Zixibacteria bacterium]